MRQSLNFGWLFTNNDSKKEEVNIPHNAVEVPYNYFSEKVYQDVFAYQKDFDVDNFNSDRVYILDFEGFMFKAEITLNGNKLGLFTSGYLPVRIDATKYIKEKIIT